jgi:hypothetical protein
MAVSRRGCEQECWSLWGSDTPPTLGRVNAPAPPDSLAGFSAPTGPNGLTGAVGLLKALANPVRLMVVVELGAGPRCVHELLEAVRRGGRDVSQEIAYELLDAHVGSIALDAIQHAQEIAQP